MGTWGLYPSYGNSSATTNNLVFTTNQTVTPFALTYAILPTALSPAEVRESFLAEDDDPIAWLRRRVKEVLWEPKAA